MGITMGQKVRPTGFRMGIVEGWRSRWYASKKEFGDLLLEDYKIRHFIKTKYQFAEIPKIQIERTREQVVVHLATARPGIIIGRKGQEVDRLAPRQRETARQSRCIARGDGQFREGARCAGRDRG